MPKLWEEMQRLNLHIVDEGQINALEVVPMLREQIKKAQDKDKWIEEVKFRSAIGKAPGFLVDE